MNRDQVLAWARQVRKIEDTLVDPILQASGPVPELRLARAAALAAYLALESLADSMKP